MAGQGRSCEISGKGLTMNILNRINKLYGKYLYVAIPLATLTIACIEVVYEINHGDTLHILENIFMLL